MSVVRLIGTGRSHRKTSAPAPWRAIAVAATLVFGGLAGGCVKDSATVAEAYGIPTPSRSLLARQASPKCEFFGSSAGASKDAWSPYAKKSGRGVRPAATREDTASDPSKSDDRRSQMQNLVSERDCYRRAEARVRGRLHKLQGSVTRTVKALQTPAIENHQQVAKRP